MCAPQSLLIALVWLIATSCFVACHRPVATSDGRVVQHNEESAPSVFQIGDVLIATDTLRLASNLAQTTHKNVIETKHIVTVTRGRFIAVTDVHHFESALPTSAETWVEIVAETKEKGWIEAEVLTQHAAPNSSIGGLMLWIENYASYLFIAIWGMVFAGWLYRCRKGVERRVVEDEMKRLVCPSFYPRWLYLTVATAALIYSTLHNYMPHVWAHYYFHPTLNPLHPDLVLALRLWVVSVWGICLIALATIDDLLHMPHSPRIASRLLQLAATCSLLYMLFGEWISPEWGGLLWAALSIGMLLRRRPHAAYQCGNCHHPLQSADEMCPACGARNIHK